MLSVGDEDVAERASLSPKVGKLKLSPPNQGFKTINWGSGKIRKTPAASVIIQTNQSTRADLSHDFKTEKKQSRSFLVDDAYNDR